MNESRYLSSAYFSNANISLRKIIKLVICCALAMIFTACSSKSSIDNNQPNISYSKNNRSTYLKQLQNWQINGKIAFINGKERDSANLYWLNDTEKGVEELNLTTFLGIKVLQASLNNGIYRIEVDGEQYQHTNIDYMISALTGYQLPSSALKYWLKALPYQNSDVIEYNNQTQLPETITGIYDFKTWQISYQNYRKVQHLDLPHQLTIKQQDITIKISIHQWNI